MNRFFSFFLGLIVLLSTTSSLAATDILAFRELKMGMERAKASSIINNMCGVNEDCCAKKECDFNSEIKGVMVRVFAGFTKEKLSRMTFIFYASEFDIVMKALIEKYGKPKSQQISIMQNGFGAQYPSRTLFWKLKGGEISMDEITSIEEMSHVIMESKAYLNEQKSVERKDEKLPGF